MFQLYTAERINAEWIKALCGIQDDLCEKLRIPCFVAVIVQIVSSVWSILGVFFVSDRYKVSTLSRIGSDAAVPEIQQKWLN